MPIIQKYAKGVINKIPNGYEYIVKGQVQGTYISLDQLIANTKPKGVVRASKIEDDQIKAAEASQKT